MRERAAFVRWALSCLLPVRRLLAAPDLSLAEALDRAGISGELRTAVLDPFLAGVLADWEGTTSATFARLLMRSFLLGSPAVPSTGISRLPELLAASLPAGTIRLDQQVIEVGQNHVRTADEEIRADAVVVATSPRAAAELTGIPMPATKPLTTFWHTAPQPPSAAKLLHLDGARRGPLVNSAVVTNVAPGYAPPGRVLIASSTVAADGSADAEAAVRRQAGLVYGVDPSDWELDHLPGDRRGPAAPAAAAGPPPARPVGQRGVHRGRPPRHRLDPGGPGLRSARGRRRHRRPHAQ